MERQARRRSSVYSPAASGDKADPLLSDQAARAVAREIEDELQQSSSDDEQAGVRATAVGKHSVLMGAARMTAILKRCGVGYVRNTGGLAEMRRTRMLPYSRTVSKSENIVNLDDHSFGLFGLRGKHRHTVVVSVTGLSVAPAAQLADDCLADDAECQLTVSVEQPGAAQGAEPACHSTPPFTVGAGGAQAGELVRWHCESHLAAALLRCSLHCGDAAEEHASAEGWVELSQAPLLKQSEVTSEMVLALRRPSTQAASWIRGGRRNYVPMLVDTASGRAWPDARPSGARRRLAEPWVFATLDDAAVRGTERGAQQEALALPDGWELAPDLEAIHVVAGRYSWGCAALVLSSGSAYCTRLGEHPGDVVPGGKHWLERDKGGLLRPAPAAGSARVLIRGRAAALCEFGQEVFQPIVALRTRKVPVAVSCTAAESVEETLRACGVHLEGTLVYSVAPGVAQKAGLRAGAVLSRWHETPISTGADVAEAFAEETPAGEFRLEFQPSLSALVGVELEGSEVRRVLPGGLAARQGAPVGASVIGINGLTVSPQDDLEAMYQKLSGHIKLVLLPSPGPRLSIAPLPAEDPDAPGAVEAALRQALGQFGTVGAVRLRSGDPQQVAPSWAATWAAQGRRPRLCRADAVMSSSSEAAAARRALVTRGFAALDQPELVVHGADDRSAVPVEVQQGPVQPCKVCVRCGDARAPLDWSGDWWEEDGSATANCVLHGNQPSRVVASLHLSVTVQAEVPQQFTVRARLACLRLIHTDAFNRFVLCVILLSSAALGVEASYAESIDDPENADLRSFITWTEIVCFIIFSAELLVKAVALGFCGSRGAYLRNAWNVIDFAVLSVSVLSLVNVGSSGVYVFRLLRVLRPIRAVSRSQELRKLVHTLFVCAPLMFNVMSLLLFVMWIFAILGIELWNGTYHQRCFLRPYNVTEDLLLGRKSSVYSQLYASRATNPGAAGMPVASGRSYVVFNDTMPCSSLGRQCDSSVLPQYCDYSAGGLPDRYQVFNFDNIGQALLAVFKIISLDDWPNDMNTAQKVSGWHAWIYFVALTVIGNYFCINLFLAVLTSLFVQEMEHKVYFAEPLVYLTPAVAAGGAGLLPAAAVAWVTRDDSMGRMVLASPWRAVPPKVDPETLRDEFIEATKPRRQPSVGSVSTLSDAGGEPGDEEAALIAAALAVLCEAAGEAPDSAEEPGAAAPPRMVVIAVLGFRFNDAALLAAIALAGACAALRVEPSGDEDTPGPHSFARTLTVSRTKSADSARRPVSRSGTCRARVDVYGGVRSGDRRPHMLEGVPSGCQPAARPSRVLEYALRGSGKSVAMRLHVYAAAAAGARPQVGVATHVVRWPELVRALRGPCVQEAEVTAGELRGGTIIVQVQTKDTAPSNAPAAVTTDEALAALASASWLGLELREVVRRRRDLRPPFSWFFYICRQPAFNIAVIVVTLVNCAALACDHYGISDAGRQRIWWINMACNIIFVVEAVIKIGGLWPPFMYQPPPEGKATGVGGKVYYFLCGLPTCTSAVPGPYFADVFNVFEFTMVVLAVIDLLSTDVELRSLAALRALRLVRVFRLINRVESFHRVLVTLVDSGKAVTYLAAFMLLFVYTYAVLGVQLFNRRLSEGYNSLLEAMISVFVVLSGDGWASEMKASILATQNGATALFHVCLFLMGNFILVNLFIAILIEHFAATSARLEDEDEDFIEPELEGEEAAPPALDEGNASAVVAAALAATVLGVVDQHWVVIHLAASAEACRDTEPYGAPQEGGAGKALWGDPDVPRHRASISELSECDDGPAFCALLPKGYDPVEWVGSPVPPDTVLCDYSVWCQEMGLVAKTRRNAGLLALSACMTAAAYAAAAAEASHVARIEKLARAGDNPQLETLHGETFHGQGGQIDIVFERIQEELAVQRRHLNKSNVGRSLGLFLPRNPLRLKCKAVLSSQWYSLLMTACVVLNGVICFLDSPNRRGSDSTFHTWSVIAEYCIFGVIVVELLIKLIFFGAWSYRNSYFRSGENIMEFCIVAACLIGIAAEDTALRAMKSSLMLRTIFWNDQLRLNVVALCMAIPEILNVAVISGVVWFMLAIIGVELYKGAYYRCVDDDPSWGTPRARCQGTYNTSYMNTFGAHPTTDQRSWQSLSASFDDIGDAMYTLFRIAVGEGWAEIMWNGLDTRGAELGLAESASIAHAPYFIATVVLVQFVVINLFVGVLFDKFNTIKVKEQEKTYGLVLTAKQRQWLEATRQIIGAGHAVCRVPPRSSNTASVVSAFRQRCFDTCQSEAFELVISALLVLNSVVMATQHYQQPRTLTVVLEWANFAFVLLFIMEAVLKLCAYGLKQYFADSWNRFDCAVTLISAVSLFFDGPGTSSVRLFRVMRILRLMKRATVLQSLVRALTMGLPSLLNAVALLTLVFFVWGVFGVELWGRIPPNNDHIEFSNFRNLGYAMVTLFEISTTEGWLEIMEWCSIEPPECNEALDECGSHLLARLYFIIFLVLSGFIIINLFVAIVIEYFDQAKRYQDNMELYSKIDVFKEAWAGVDLEQKLVLQARQFVRILRLLQPPLWLPSGHPDTDPDRKRARRGTNSSQFCNTMDQLRNLFVPVRDKRAGRGACHVSYMHCTAALVARLVGCRMEEATEASLLHPNDPLVPRLDVQHRFAVCHWYAADFIRSSWVQARVASGRRRGQTAAQRGGGGGPSAVLVVADAARMEALQRQQRFLLEAAGGDWATPRRAAAVCADAATQSAEPWETAPHGVGTVPAVGGAVLTPPSPVQAPGLPGRRPERPASGAPSGEAGRSSMAPTTDATPFLAESARSGSTLSSPITAETESIGEVAEEGAAQPQPLGNGRAVPPPRTRSSGFLGSARGAPPAPSSQNPITTSFWRPAVLPAPQQQQQQQQPVPATPSYAPTYSPPGSAPISPRLHSWAAGPSPRAPQGPPQRTPAATRSSTGPAAGGPPPSPPDRGRLLAVFGRLLQSPASRGPPGRLSASAMSIALLQGSEAAEMRRELTLPSSVSDAADAVAALWRNPPPAVAAAAAAGGLRFGEFEEAVRQLLGGRQPASAAAARSASSGWAGCAAPAELLPDPAAPLQWRSRTMSAPSQRARSETGPPAAASSSLPEAASSNSPPEGAVEQWASPAHREPPAPRRRLSRRHSGTEDGDHSSAAAASAAGPASAAPSGSSGRPAAPPRRWLPQQAVGSPPPAPPPTECRGSLSPERHPAAAAAAQAYAASSGGSRASRGSAPPPPEAQPPPTDAQVVRPKRGALLPPEQVPPGPPPKVDSVAALQRSPRAAQVRSASQLRDVGRASIGSPPPEGPPAEQLSEAGSLESTFAMPGKERYDPERHRELTHGVYGQVRARHTASARSGSAAGSGSAPGY
eukprot:TRINITY_DN13451_c0_g1_i2.p1 TRINITY_DN13451_c0_g1~~TRINITY_DN13451_c0_g1_i2.p1  ORF type:complete len:3365 (+),score=976.18 TRINITY_DN13451_c0_g1_i2:103-10197(+)